MKILAVDSSGLVASVAILEDENIIAEYTVNFKKTHSQTLLPMLDEIVKMTETDLNSVDAIAVAAGPGSFTGLRIGSATVKGLGLALDKPIISVPTVEGIAYNIGVTDAIICPILDARRGQVYTGIYGYEEDKFVVLEEQMATSIEDILDKLATYNKRVIFMGDGVPVFKEIICEKLKCKYSFAPAHINKQRAASVAARGAIYYDQGKLETAAEHNPEYLRLSQAERELLEKQNKEKDNSR